LTVFLRVRPCESVRVCGSVCVCCMSRRDGAPREFELSLPCGMPRLLASCGVLQCVAVSCSELQCVAVCCSVLHCMCEGSVLQCICLGC